MHDRREEPAQELTYATRQPARSAKRPYLGFLHRCRPVRRGVTLRVACLLGLAVGLALTLRESPSYVAQAQEGRVQAATTPQPLRPGDLSLEHSRVFVHVGKVGLGHEHAVMGNLKSGQLHLGASERAGSLEFDITSFVADTPTARQYLGLEGDTSESTQQQVNHNMLGPAVLNAAKYPTAKFDIDSALPMEPDARTGLPRYELNGTFTLHGQSQPLKFPLVIQQEKNGYQHIRCGFTIKQTDYGIKPFTKALGAIGVADALKIYGDAWLVKETP